MRLMELLLVLACLALLFQLLFVKKRSRITGIAVSAGSAALLVMHLLFEGYRWQMMFIYIIMILYIGAILAKNTRMTISLRKPMKYSLYSISVLLIGISILISVVLPVFHFPEPDGPYRIGTQTLHLIDRERAEIFTDDDGDQRELMVQIWYPAEPRDRADSRKFFSKDKRMLEQYSQAYATELSLPSFMLDYWKYVESNSYSHAPVLQSDSPYPLVIISHGMGTGTLFHISQAENLASHGFIVAAIDHTYSTLATIYPDGRVTEFETVMNDGNFIEAGIKLGEVWTEDVNFVINQLDRINTGAVTSDLRGAIDLENIGMMGHSFGGATAFNTTYVNDKIKAGVNMDGTLFEVTNRKNMNKPFMFMKAEDYISGIDKLKNAPDVDKQLAKHLLDEWSIIDEVTKQEDSSLMLIEGMAHYNFTDLPLFSPIINWTGMTGDIDGDRGALIVNRYVLDFFNKHLKGMDSTLLKGPSADYPEVRFYKK